MGGGVDSWLKASPELLQLEALLDQVAELISVGLFSCTGHDLELVELHDLVLVVLEVED